VAHVTLDHLRREDIGAGRDGGVRGEDRAGADQFHRLAEGELALVHHQADPLEGEEGAVPFVHVVDAGAQVQRDQRPHAADAEQQFLLDAQLLVAAVQPSRPAGTR